MNKKSMNWKRILPFYLMVLPGTIYMLVDKYIPMFGIIIAFKKLDVRKGILNSPWCGFKNFEFLFQYCDQEKLADLERIAVAIIFAILLNEITSKKASKTYQTVTLLPYLMSWVVIGYLAYAYLSADTGLINKSILEPVGKEGINWYQEAKYWPFILTFFNLWKSVGYTMIIFLSSIVGISQDYFEAARLDGATKLQQIRYITLPLLKPTIITLMIIMVGQIFRSDFGLFYQVPRNSGSLYAATRTLDVYVYQALLKYSDYAMSSAASFYQSVVGLILILVVNKVIKKTSPDSALF